MDHHNALNYETPPEGTSLSSTDVLFAAKKIPSDGFRNSEQHNVLITKIVMSCDALLRWGVGAIIFFIPLQTILILRQGVLYTPSHQPYGGVWQYGTLGIYGTDVLIGFLFVVWCVGVCARRRFPACDGATLCAFFLALLALCSSFWSGDTILALSRTLWLWEGVFLFYITRSLNISWQSMARFFVAGAVLQAGGAIIQWFMQSVFANTWLGMSAHSAEALGDSVVESTLRRWLRAYGTFPHPNILGAYLAVGYGACVSLVEAARRKSGVLAFTAAGIVILAALFFTFSREAWVGLCGGILAAGALHIYRKRAGKNPPVGSRIISPMLFFFTLSLVCVASLSVIFFEPLSTRLGIGGVTRLEKKSISERVQGFGEAHTLIQNSWQGVGMGNYTSALSRTCGTACDGGLVYRFQPVHSLPLLIAAELGIAGASLFLLFLFFTLRGMIKNFYDAQNRFVVGVVCAMIVMSMFDHFFWTSHAGILLWWVVIGVGTVVDKE